MTAGALAHVAADTAFKTTNINLTGLALSGIEYSHQTKFSGAFFSTKRRYGGKKHLMAIGTYGPQKIPSSLTMVLTAVS